MLYASAIFLSSALLFLCQPMMAKAILPWFGGSAGVWTACMLFFQVVLLLGYLYAYCTTRYLSARAQAASYIVLLITTLAVLPMHLANRWMISAAAHPVLSILGVLGASIGLPYFALSTTGPLMQTWYARESEARPPYRLFALSNLGSLLALLAYPLSIEPLLPSQRQLTVWSIAYLLFVLLGGGLALRNLSKPLSEKQQADGESTRRPLLWMSLAACASSLWLAVANHLSQEVAAIPFLWVLPLGLYLLSFILCFERNGWYRPLIFRWLLPAAWIAVCYRIALQGSVGGLQWEIPVFSAA